MYEPENASTERPDHKTGQRYRDRDLQRKDTEKVRKHSVLKGGSEKCFFRENQRFVLVNWVKLLNAQPWGPRLSDGEKNYGQKTAIFDHI